MANEAKLRAMAAPQITRLLATLLWIEQEASRALSSVGDRTSEGRTARAAFERIGMKSNKTRAAIVKAQS